MRLDLELLVPDRTLIRSPVTAVRAADQSGWFGILPGHQDLITVLVPCILTYADEQQHSHYVAVDGGVLLLEKGKLTVATRDAIQSDHFDDVADRVASMLKARRDEEGAASTSMADSITALLEGLSQIERA